MGELPREEEPGQEQEEVLNNRQEAILREFNAKTGLNLPLTEEGYNQAGRSDGVVEKLVELGEDRKEILKRFLSISRTRPGKQE